MNKALNLKTAALRGGWGGWLGIQIAGLWLQCLGFAHDLCLALGNTRTSVKVRKRLWPCLNLDNHAAFHESISGGLSPSETETFPKPWPRPSSAKHNRKRMNNAVITTSRFAVEIVHFFGRKQIYTLSMNISLTCSVSSFLQLVRYIKATLCRNLHFFCNLAPPPPQFRNATAWQTF